MPIATPRQYQEMLDAAAAGRWALPAVNVTSSQTLIGVLQGLTDAGSDGIVQVTTGGGAYLGGDSPGSAARGAAALAAFAHEAAASFPALVALHTDHCLPDDAEDFLGPLLDRSARRRRAGLPPLFQSHMFDGSVLPLAENLQRSAGWLGRCAALDVILELECGVVGGEEDGVNGDRAGSGRLYTTPQDLLAVADALGTGERGRYLLAATFGNLHGIHAAGVAHLRPEILGAGQRALAGRHPGARFAYVFHGSSGTPPGPLREAIDHGVVKVNVDTAMQQSFTGAVAHHVDAHREAMRRLDGPEAKLAYDPRTWGRRAQHALASRVAAECETLGSAGRTLARGPVGGLPTSHDRGMRRATDGGIVGGPSSTPQGVAVKPTIILVHGAFAESSSWNGILGPLQDAGHTTIAVANPLRAVPSDAQYVTDVVRSVEGPIVLVGHSYGGAVMTDVASDAGDIVGLVYLSGFAPDVGETAGELAGRFPGSSLAPTLRSVEQTDGATDLYIAQDAYHAQFAGDLPEEVSREMGATQRPILAAAFDDKTVAPLWRSIPSWFMFGELDRNIPVACHRFMAERAGSRRTVEIAGASHVVGMSHPDELIELILEAANVDAYVAG